MGIDILVDICRGRHGLRPIANSALHPSKTQDKTESPELISVHISRQNNNGDKLRINIIQN